MAIQPTTEVASSCYARFVTDDAIGQPCTSGRVPSWPCLTGDVVSNAEAAVSHRRIAKGTPMADRLPVGFRQVSQHVHYLGSGARDENLFARLEERIDSFPPVADDDGSSCRCFENAGAGTEPRRAHVGACDVQGETLTIAKLAVLARSKVLDVLNVGRPLEVRWVHRTRYSHPAFLPLAGRGEQQFLDMSLSVLNVRTEVPKVPFFRERPGIMESGVH